MNMFVIILTILLCLAFGFLIIWNVIGIAKNIKARKSKKVNNDSSNKEV